MKLRIGTRGSKLAVYQALQVIKAIEAYDKNIVCEIVKIKTSGDKLKDINLHYCGGKALFLKEIEEALLNGEVDIAVHSAKDVPGVLPKGVVIESYLEREDPRECFLSYKYKNISELPKGSVIGTCSPRRKGQLLQLRPDLKFQTFRGNVPTRLKKLLSGEVDASILAIAGLKRLGLLDYANDIIDIDIMQPAVGQGAICMECREDDQLAREVLRNINHKETKFCVELEREFLKSIDGDCSTALAAHVFKCDKGYKMSLWHANEDFSNFAHRVIDETLFSQVKQIAHEMKGQVRAGVR